MNNDIVTSITIYGKINDESYTWKKWYEACKKIINLLGYETNYVSIESKKLNAGKVMKLENAEKKLLLEIANEDEIKWISAYSLPNDFVSAAFDYNVLIVRTNDYISLIIAKEDYEKIHEAKLISLLKEHIDITYGEIYEMNRDECPLIYASKANSASSFGTLKIIKEISK